MRRLDKKPKPPSRPKTRVRISVSKKQVTGFQPVEVFAKYKDAFKDDFAIMRSSQSGVQSGIFYELASVSDISRSKLANKVFGMSPRTLSRQAESQKSLPPHQAELALKLLALYHKGIEIFGKKAHFNNWLQKPAAGLGAQIPFSMLGLSTGIDLVMDELYRLEFGDLA